MREPAAWLGGNAERSAPKTRAVQWRVHGKPWPWRASASERNAASSIGISSVERALYTCW